MLSLNVYTSNRMETLVEQLAGIVAEPLSSPFVSEVIVVQSKGMERWLSMELATRVGVWANCRFPFPNRFTWEIFEAVLGGVSDLDLLGPEASAWRIVRVLPDCLAREGFEALRLYLGSTQPSLKKLQLAERIADIFDTYAVYRPERILGWDRGLEHHWQAQLWRLLYSGERFTHRARIWRDALTALSALHDNDGVNGPHPAHALPERVSVFGIPALPRYHLEILKALSDRIPVHLFLFNPSKEYWVDIVPERRIVSAERAEKEKSSFPLEMHFEIGNPLLASLGTLGRDFFRAILELESEPISDFDDPGEGSILAAIQSDILNLRNRGEKGLKADIDSADASLQVHSCHSPWREIEVLYDTLLNFFETRRDLTPRDVLVMTPNVETYAPYISAVFDACQDKRKRIPYSIADRRVPSESLVIDLFLKITGLCRSRLQASQIMDILSSTIVRSRFSLSAEEIDVIHRWVVDTRTRWGIDGEHRAIFGLPAFEGNSWKAGMERLILGYALQGDGEELFLDRLPYHGVEGDEAKTLGRFLEFMEQLFNTVRDLEVPRTLGEWSDALDLVRSAFITEDDDTAADTQLLRTQLKELKRLQELSGFEDPVEIEVVRYYLLTQLKYVQLSKGFLTGGVTFCEMLPMRSIPFRVVALVGMNNDAYPREERPVGFDLIAQDPQPGDRSLRDEDRYLFLEALLSAREFFYISYVGQSVRDNSVIPPSVLVSELLDYCEQSFSARHSSSTTGFLVTSHRLQAFSPAYFTGKGRLSSYSQEDFATAIARSSPRHEAARFIARPLSEPPPDLKQVTIQDLKRFYQNPARYILNRRLGIYLEEPERILQGDEPFSLKGLDRYMLGDLLTRKALRGEELNQYLAVARAQGILPPGVPGELAFNRLESEVEAFTRQIRPHVAAQQLPPIEVDLEIAGFGMSGRLDGIWPSGIVAFRVAKDKGRYQLAAWIDHLILNQSRKQGYPVTTRLITLDKTWLYQPVEGSAEMLEKLLHLYWQGLTEPLRLFPESSINFAERIRKGEKIPEALKAVQTVWQGSDFVRGVTGEGSDPYLGLCFGEADPFIDPFSEIALAVLGPLMEHREKVR
ncbi:MAG TPA: exodeoxyribonuclease V subunit gamma [Syntrophorhabdales bacterium]|nr:exodeoxyribonuclease V subunit gamma [Syntrophorhabdales bacterium]